jgi:hypothetical protein
MESENVTLETIDEMWNVIESFGIKRDVFSKSNPSYQDIQVLYLLIKEKSEKPKTS